MADELLKNKTSLREPTKSRKKLDRDDYWWLEVISAADVSVLEPEEANVTSLHRVRVFERVFFFLIDIVSLIRSLCSLLNGSKSVAPTGRRFFSLPPLLLINA